jgi:NADH dehydrogenase
MENRHVKPVVVIVGAGFGGLECAKRLAKANADIIVIDRKNHHCFQPLLYQVATASLSPADVAWPIRSVLAEQANARVVMTEVTGIDAAAQLVHTSSGIAFDYDFLVLATGATHSYFAHPDWEAVAPGLKTVEDATRIRAKILRAFEKAELSPDENERRRLMTFVIIGGGPTGVELAGSIADIARNVLAADFRTISPASARILLIEAGPRVLGAFPPTLSAYAEESLRRMGVEIMTKVAVTDCQDTFVVTSQNETIPTDCILWAAGVAASPAAKWLSMPADRAGRVPVDQFLKVAPHANIFAIGDTAHVESNGKPVPGLASAAKEMGQYVGSHLRRVIAGQRAETPFVYRHQGDLATIGRKSAVVKLGRLRLTGFMGWLFWSVVHVFFLIGVRNRIVVALNWMWEYITFQRGARLISSDEKTLSGLPRSRPQGDSGTSEWPSRLSRAMAAFCGGQPRGAEARVRRPVGRFRPVERRKQRRSADAGNAGAPERDWSAG